MNIDSSAQICQILVQKSCRALEKWEDIPDFLIDEWTENNILARPLHDTLLGFIIKVRNLLIAHRDAYNVQARRSRQIANQAIRNAIEVLFRGLLSCNIPIFTCFIRWNEIYLANS
jgi:hypothetical protein